MIVKLTSVAVIGTPKGFTPLAQKNGKVPFIGMKNIDAVTGLNSTYELRDINEVRKGYTKFNENSVLLAKITPCTENNKTALISGIQGGYATTEVFVIYPSSRLFPKYLLYFLRSPKVRSEIIKEMSGATGRQRVPTSAIEKLQISLPTIEEQKLIVRKLDKGLEKTSIALEKIKYNIEKSTELLSIYIHQTFQNLKRDYKSKKIKEISEKIQYGYTGNKKTSGKYRYLRITDIQEGKVDWSNVPYADIEESEARKYLLHEGDIVFARSGATSGKSFLIGDAKNAIFASYLIRVICDKKTIIPNYLYTFFQSPQYWQQVREKVSGAAQPNVNGQKLGSIQLPVPPIHVQERVVKKIR